MSTIDLAEFTKGVVGVDAAAIATAFGVDPANVLDLLRDAKITSDCEQGIGKDAGCEIVWNPGRAARRISGSPRSATHFCA